MVSASKAIGMTFTPEKLMSCSIGIFFSEKKTQK